MIIFNKQSNKEETSFLFMLKIDTMASYRMKFQESQVPEGDKNNYLKISR